MLLVSSFLDAVVLTSKKLTNPTDSYPEHYLFKIKNYSTLYRKTSTLMLIGTDFLKYYINKG